MMLCSLPYDATPRCFAAEALSPCFTRQLLLLLRAYYFAGMPRHVALMMHAIDALYDALRRHITACLQQDVVDCMILC